MNIIDHCSNQGLSQDLETGYPKFAFVIFWGILLFKGGPQYTQVTTINMYLLIYIRHNNLIQYHGIYVGDKKNSIICFENDI